VLKYSEVQCDAGWKERNERGRRIRQEMKKEREMQGKEHHFKEWT
jgi:hypothetical protein